MLPVEYECSSSTPTQTTDESELAGTHNSSDLNLFWESDSPVTVNRDLHLTEYRLVNMWSNFSVANYSLTADVNTAFGLQSRLYGKFGEYRLWEQNVTAWMRGRLVPWRFTSNKNQGLCPGMRRTGRKSDVLDSSACS